MSTRQKRAGWRSFRLLLAASVMFPFQASDAQASAGPGQGLGLSFRCRLVATVRGEEIMLTLKLRTNEPQREWRIRILHESEPVYSKVRTTDARGDLKVRRLVPNLRGRDDLLGRARDLGTGAICKVASHV